MSKPTPALILKRITEMEQIRDEAEAAGDTEHTRQAVRLLGILWQAFAERMGQPDRSPEEFERLYTRLH
jgi:hypothetical protein